MTRKKIRTKQVQEITGLAQSTIRAGKAGTHVLTRTKHGRTIRYYLDEVEALAEGKKPRQRTTPANEKSYR